MRTYREGDAEAWCQIMSRSMGTEWTVERFFSQVHDKSVFRADGLFFATRDDYPVASACAWWLPEEDGPDIGVVHMVATDPDHRHRGLGRAVSLSVVHFMSRLKMKECVLTTYAARPTAIRLYLSLGFEPVFDSPEAQAIWKQILGEQTS